MQDYSQKEIKMTTKTYIDKNILKTVNFLIESVRYQ